MNLSMLRNRNIIAGACVVALGAGYAWKALDYDLGDATRMGPGYLPFALGLILTALGLGIVATGIWKWHHQEEPVRLYVNWRAVLVLPASILLFGFLIDRLGLGPTTALVVWASTIADSKISVLRGMVIGIVVAAFCVLLFRVGLGLQIEVFKWRIF